ncbi:hypothetical protein IWX50DRAFT_618411 [Phyllosticta citricarpa]
MTHSRALRCPLCRSPSSRQATRRRQRHTNTHKHEARQLLKCAHTHSLATHRDSCTALSRLVSSGAYSSNQPDPVPSSRICRDKIAEVPPPCLALAHGSERSGQRHRSDGQGSVGQEGRRRKKKGMRREGQREAREQKRSVDDRIPHSTVAIRWGRPNEGRRTWLATYLPINADIDGFRNSPPAVAAASHVLPTGQPAEAPAKPDKPRSHPDRWHRIAIETKTKSVRPGHQPTSWLEGITSQALGQHWQKTGQQCFVVGSFCRVSGPAGAAGRQAGRKADLHAQVQSLCGIVITIIIIIIIKIQRTYSSRKNCHGRKKAESEAVRAGSEKDVQHR